MTVRAVSPAEWTFMEWGGALRGHDATNILVMDSDKTISATFGTPLSVSTAGSGTVSSFPAAPLYPYWSAPRLTAIHAPGSYFKNWLWDGEVGPVSPLDFGVTEPNPSVSAVFAPLPANKVSLIVLIDGGGYVGGQASMYQTGATATLRAVPASGQKFLGWSGDASGIATPLSLPMNASKVVTARFSHATGVGIRSEGPKLRLSVSGVIGDTFRIESSTNLSTWLPFATVTNFFDVAIFYDAPTNGSTKMYRAVKQ